MKKTGLILACVALTVALTACRKNSILPVAGDVQETAEAESTPEAVVAEDTDNTAAKTEEIHLAAPSVNDGVMKPKEESIEVYFEWAPVDGADGYEVSSQNKYRTEDKFREPAEVSETTDTHFTESAQDEFDFLIKVRAYKGSGDGRVYGEWSAEAKGSAYEDDFLSVRGIEISPQGEYSIIMSMSNEDGSKKGEVSAPFDVKIEENTDGCDPGYKKVVASFSVDITNAGDDMGYAYFISAFDRKTGTSFEFGEPESRSKAVLGDQSDGIISADMFVGYEPPIEKPVITVLCPSDYDGTVFYIGYYDDETEFDGSVLEKKVVEADDIPFFHGNGYEYYFFTYSDD